MDDSSFIKIGPAGYNGGQVWDEKGKNKIVQIFIWHNDENIISIQFQYAENGTLVLSGRHGSTSKYSRNFDVVELNYPLEYITWISGRTSRTTDHGQFGTSHGLIGGGSTTNHRQFGTSHGLIGGGSTTNHGLVVDSITFGTNHGQYGPFGRFNSSDKGENCQFGGFNRSATRSKGSDGEFTFRLGGNCHCQFGGFHGTSNDTAITSIGVYLKPNTTLNHSLHKSTVKPKKEKEGES